MKIKRLEISGFRAFATSYSFDLAADAVILVGANGTGKTSLFDAILWALTGRVTRIGPEPTSVVSMYSESGEAYVRLELERSQAESVAISRRFDGTHETFQFESNGTAARDDLGRAQMLNSLWPQALLTEQPDDALTLALTRSVYLQQDLVREFVEGITPSDRFNALSELVGTGRMTELQTQLERAKKSWTAATNSLSADSAEIERRVNRLEAQLAELSTASIEAVAISDDWRRWWQELTDAGIAQQSVPDPSSVDASVAIDTAIKQLSATVRNLDRRREEAEELATEIDEARAIQSPDTSDLRNRLARVEDAVARARADLIAAEHRAAEERRALVERRESADELRSLAQLALRHLDGKCPVCGQDHDVEATRARLQQFTQGQADRQVDSTPALTTEAAIALERHEKELLALQAELVAKVEAQKKIDSASAERERRIEELGITEPVPAAADPLRHEAHRLQQRLLKLAQLRTSGENLALAVARAGESARRIELDRQRSALHTQLRAMRANLEARTRTGDLAQSVIDQLRTAGSRLVASQLDAMQPLLQRIYGRVDPHPTLRSVRLLSSFTRGRGQLATEVADLEVPRISVAPGTVLSSSQSNALAVSIFLTLNLGLPLIPLSTALLDDPLQSLDDVNLLGLIDLLKRTKDRRQLVLSTHDRRFGQLLARKLRPIDSSQRTRVLEFKNWDRSGPTIEQSEIVLQRESLLVVA